MTTDIVIIGTGGQGRECLDIVDAMNEDGASFNVIGFVDDSPTVTSRQLIERLGYSILGTVDSFLASPKRAQVCIGIGSGKIRHRIDQRLHAAHVDSPILVHPSSTLGSRVVLGNGSVIWAGARLTTNIRMGRHVHINQNATIGHDCSLSDYVTVNPLAAVSGNVQVGTASMIGAGAVVLQGLNVADNAAVGAGACVTRHVEEGSVVTGVPAQPRPADSRKVTAQ